MVCYPVAPSCSPRREAQLRRCTGLQLPEPNWLLTTTVFGVVLPLMLQHSRCACGFWIGVIPVGTVFCTGLQSVSKAPTLGTSPFGLKSLISRTFARHLEAWSTRRRRVTQEVVEATGLSRRGHGLYLVAAVARRREVQAVAAVRRPPVVGARAVERDGCRAWHRAPEDGLEAAARDRNLTLRVRVHGVAHRAAGTARVQPRQRRDVSDRSPWRAPRRWCRSCRRPAGMSSRSSDPASDLRPRSTRG